MDALVLASGGIDSAVTLQWALSEGWDVRGLTFDYHRRPDAERRAVEAQFDRLDLEPPLVVDLPFLREAEDTPEATAALDDAPEGYIPARNAVFYAIAAHHAEMHGIPRIVGGHNGGDGDEFPDASSGFFEDLTSLLARGLHTATGLRIEIPLKERTKADVVRLGHKLDVPFDATWSCNFDGDRHCGECSSCRERREAFDEAGVPDPVDHEVDR